jgi:hypothetical protein
MKMSFGIGTGGFSWFEVMHVQQELLIAFDA